MKQGRLDRGQGPRYWDIHPDALPGAAIAHHDGGIGLDPAKVGPGQDAPRASGPGNYTVTVRNPGKPIPGDDRMPGHRTIELASYVTLPPGTPFRFNRGMARWFGMRLIEAAELDEALGSAGGGPRQSQAEVDNLRDWMRRNAAEWLDESAVTESAIALLGHAKRILAAHPELGEDPAAQPEPRALAEGLATLPGVVQKDTGVHDEAVAQLKMLAQRLIDQQSAAAAMELKSARAQAIAQGDITEQEWRTEVLGSFDSAHQAIIRGRMT